MSDTQPGGAQSGQVRRLAFVRGRVQGVGFRWWVRSQALELGLVGHARNLADGRVEVNAQGAPEAVDTLVALLTEQPSLHSRPGHVSGVVTQDHPLQADLRGFRER